jgi:TetR/AcrR family transcriptional repressor of nem operon
MTIDIAPDFWYNAIVKVNRSQAHLPTRSGAWLKESCLMKKSKAETAETRCRIVKAAAAAFRQNGIQGTGLADVMAAAGLTHGGFYRHFDSKDQLVAEACASGMKITGESPAGDAHRRAGNARLEAIAARYLSADHRDNPSEGCLLAALGSELARADDNARAAVTAGFVKLVDELIEPYARTNAEAAKARAIVALSAMVGALTMSRIVTDPKLSAAILRHTKNHLASL